MTRDASTHRSLRALTWTSILLLVSGSVPGSSAPPAETPGTVVATIREVDAKALTIELITGVGHALRVIEMPVAPECEIRGMGTTAGLDDLRAGYIVRVQSRSAPGKAGAPAWVAVSIDCLPAEGIGAAR